MTSPTRRIALTSLVFGLFAALALVAAQAGALPSSRAAVDPADLHTRAGAAVAALTGSHPMSALAALGEDPRRSLGYDPVVIDGSPADPDGNCSSPIPLPARFEPLCKIHDLGYDLLRLAARDGHPLRPWAREHIDEQLIDAMHRSCTDPICEVGADAAAIGLSVNTWRQRAGTPVGGENAGSIAVSVVTRTASWARR